MKISKLLSGEELLNQLDIINKKVMDKLGKQKNNVVVIDNNTDFHNYITKCIESGVIAIDTETDNSVDPSTCKIMGLCLYSPGLKQAYIPVNHRNPITKDKLDNQIIENEIKTELQRVVDNKTLVVMHNGKFDYQVLKCTCGIEIIPEWDTMVAAILLNENESASLKKLYCKYIDKSQDAYSIDKLFDKVQYSDVDPNVFALYAAHDSGMTYELYRYQNEKFQSDEQDIYKLFKEIEMPMVVIAAEIELNGAYVDTKYCEKLKEKYIKKENEAKERAYKVLEELNDVFMIWKESSKAQENERIFPKYEKIAGMSYQKYVEMYPYENKTTGRRYKKGKKYVDLISNPVKLTSSKQLEVLFYEVFGVGYLPKSDNPRGTGTKHEIRDLIAYFKDLVEKIKENKENLVKNKEELLDEDDMIIIENENLDPEKYYQDKITSCQNKVIKILNKHFTIFQGDSDEEIEKGYKRIDKIIEFFEVLSQMRGYNKILSTYINVIPPLAEHWPDGKIRFHLNTLGARTGRFSSGGDWMFVKDDKHYIINGMCQQGIPSKNHEIRILFKAGPGRVFIGGDFNQQEPKCTAFVSQDEKMLDTFRHGRDIYATIAQTIFGGKLEDNMEFYPEGTEIEIAGKKVICGHKTHVNKSGKERRKVGKTIVLATNYGMGAKAVGKDLGISTEKASEMLMKFYKGFPNVKKAIDRSEEICKKQGYVEGIYGRKRRLPDMMLPRYSVKFDIKSGIKGKEAEELVKYWKEKVESLTTITDEEYITLVEEAKKNNIIIVDNSAKIAEAKLKCYNSRIQGSAATLTKATMILVYNDKILRECDAHMVFQIHDELILDCPKDKAELVKERLKALMENSVYAIGMTLGMTCDVEDEYRWGEGAIAADIREDYEKLLKDNSVEVAFNKICNEYSNFPKESITKVIDGTSEILEFEW